MSSSSCSSSSSKCDPAGGGFVTLPTKQEKLLELIKKKKECDRKAHDILLQLIEKGVNKDFLLQHAIDLGPNHWDDIVEERRLTAICGWTLCDNSLPQEITNKSQKYIIRGKRVLDITHRKSYCSSKCYARSIHFKKQLPTSPLWLRDQEDLEESEGLVFHVLDDETELHGVTINLTGLDLEDPDQQSDESSKSNDDDDVS